jgi:hypothetical protein
MHRLVLERVLQRGGARERGGVRRAVAPVDDGLLLRAHLLVEVVRLVQLVRLGLLRVEPALEELGVVLGKDLVALVQLAQLELERVDLVV